MSKIIATGDFHICKSNRSEAENSLNQILQVIHNKGGSHLAILGDIFNSDHPSLEDIGQLVKFITSIPKYVSIYIVEGNHEKERKDKKLLQWISWVRPNIHYAPDLLTTTISSKKIAMMHEAFSESNIHEKAKSNLSYTQFKEYEVILSGHIHSYQIISRRPLVLHPGSIFYCSFKEANDFKKGVILIDLETLRYEFIALKVTKIKQVESNLRDAKRVLDSLDNNLKVKLVLCLNYDESKRINEINNILQLGKNKFKSFSYDIKVDTPLASKNENIKKQSVSDLFIKFCKEHKVDKQYQEQLSRLLSL